ncbi:MAG: hypothetical protein AAFV54_06095, partial [Pseudomonadota bacterium]
SALVLAWSDATARVFDAESGKPTQVLDGHNDPLLGAAFSFDGSRVCTVSLSGSARIWDAESSSVLHTRKVGQRQVGKVRYSRSGALCLTSLSGDKLEIWDPDDSNNDAVIHFDEEISLVCTGSDLILIGGLMGGCFHSFCRAAD